MAKNQQLVISNSKLITKYHIHIALVWIHTLQSKWARGGNDMPVAAWKHLNEATGCSLPFIWININCSTQNLYPMPTDKIPRTKRTTNVYKKQEVNACKLFAVLATMGMGWILHFLFTYKVNTGQAIGIISQLTCLFMWKYEEHKAVRRTVEPGPSHYHLWCP
jgi:hypothetical protein